MEEIWKPFPIKELQDEFEISNLGRGRRKPWVTYGTRNRTYYNEGYILKQYDRRGYKMFDLMKNNQRFSLYVHRIVALAFIDNPLYKKEINHIDANKSNNCVTNLEWVTKEENMNHAKKYHLMHPPSSYNNNRSKEVVMYDTKLNIYKNFGSIGECARFLNCKTSTVQKCLYRTTGNLLYNRYSIKFVKK